jgi:hypothetical protein
VKSDYAGHGAAYLSFIEKTSGAAIGTVPGGPAAPRCGYEGADIRLLADASNPCASWQLQSGDDGYVGLRNKQTNKVAEAAACGNADGTNVAQWGWLHNDCQQFALNATTGGWVSLESKVAPGKVIDGGPACAAGSDAVLWSAASDRCQQFRVQPNGPVLIVGAESDTPVSLPCRGPRSGCDEWTFRHTSDGYYRISNGTGPNSDKSKSVAGCRISDLRSVRECLQWKLVPVGDGEFQLAERYTGRVLAQVDGRITVQRSADAAAQRFRLVQP